MSQGVQQYPCSVCGKGGHQASRCKELGIPPDGFYKPSPGQHQHDEDCDDEAINLAQIHYSYRKWYQKVIKMHKSSRIFSP